MPKSEIRLAHDTEGYSRAAVDRGFGFRASDFRAACPARISTTRDRSAASPKFFMVGGPEMVTLLPKQIRKYEFLRQTEV
jgi:hypothetical protein